MCVRHFIQMFVPAQHFSSFFLVIEHGERTTKKCVLVQTFMRIVLSVKLLLCTLVEIDCFIV